MTRSVLVVSAVLLFSLHANKYDEVYHKANKDLKAGQYQDALKGYESLTPQGPVTYYNTGIVLYYLKQYGKSIAAWSKAEQHASPGLLKKIQYNKSKVYKVLNSEAPASWRVTVLIVQSYFSLFLLQVFFLAAWLGYCFVGYIPNKIIQKYRTLLLLMSVICGCLLGCKYWVHACKRAVVITPQAKIFTGPNVEFDTIADVKEGELVRVVQKENTWYKINDGNANGWIQSVNIEEIN